MFLAGDIGGTKTALGLFEEGSGPGNPVAQRVFESNKYSSLEEITAEFIREERPENIRAACLAVAGPILSGTATITNLPWTVDEATLVYTLDVRDVKLINDVQAVANSVTVLDGKDLQTLSPGEPHDKGTIAVIAAGTGLGEAFLTWNGSSYVSHPTEGGHSDFAPSDDRQAGLLSFMREKKGHVSWETVCSGIGIQNIYDYLKGTGQYQGPGTVPELEGYSTDRTPAIIGAALQTDQACPLCLATVEMFVSILGAESGNLSLKTMATGGLFLGGGIPPRVLKILQGGLFMEAFRSKGRLTPVMETIPVHVILNPGAALIGAAAEAMGNDRIKQL